MNDHKPKVVPSYKTHDFRECRHWLWRTKYLECKHCKKRMGATKADMLDYIYKPIEECGGK